MKKLILFLLFIIGIQSYAQVSYYTFAQTTGTYSPITGGLVLGDTSNDDERFVDPTNLSGSTTSTGVGFPIGFDFTYNGTVFNRFAVNTNGWISLGQSTLTPSVSINNSYYPLSDSSVPSQASLRSRISVFGNDLNGQTGSEIMVKTIGTAPNRTLVVQWKGYRKYNASGQNLNFQIQLHETSNLVSIVYGTMTFSSSSYNAQVGLGGISYTDFNNRKTDTDWNATTAGTSSDDVCKYSTTQTAPVSGTTFTYTPAEQCAGTPSAGTASPVEMKLCKYSYPDGNFSVTGGTVASGLAYQWEQSADGGTTFINVNGGSNGTLPYYTPPYFNGTTVQYRLKTTCISSGLSAISSISTLSAAAGPVANVGADKEKPCTAGIAIGAEAVEGTTYSWSPTNGLSSATVSNPIANPDVTTSYWLTATLTATGCEVDDVIRVTVNTPVANAGLDATVCSGTEGKVIGSSAQTGVTYSWSPATGLSSATVANPTANPTATTQYTLTTTHTASGCTKSDSVLVTTSATPVAPTVTASGATSFCAGESVTLTSSNANTNWYKSGFPFFEASSVFGTTGGGPRGIVIDSQGNIYTANSGSNNVTKITPAGVSSIHGTTGNTPYGITIDAQGNIYTANYNDDNVTKITPEGVSTILGTTGYGPYGITIDAQGNIYTSNNFNNNVSKITPEGVSTILGYTGGSPKGIAVDGQGNVYTANYNNDTVSKISQAGVTTTLTNPGSDVWAVALDSHGNIYTANSGSNDVTITSPTGVSRVFATTGTRPSSIVIDALGNIYTANYESNNISVITPEGVSSILGTTGVAPLAIALDAKGNIYTANSTANNVTKVEKSISVSHTITSTVADVGSSNVYKAVVMNNEGCSASTETTVTIKSKLPTIIYATATNVFYKDVAITSLTPQYLGCTDVTGYTIDPALPAGLAFDTATGVISGTPTVFSPSASYTVTATNVDGNGNFVLTIEVISIKPVISYVTPQSYVVGKLIQPLQPTNTGADAESFSITPVLPSGLFFNTTSGNISGTPTIASDATEYTITATNANGSGTFVLTLDTKIVAGIGLPIITYTTTPQVFTTGTAITTLSPLSTVDCEDCYYSVSPYLPSGLDFDYETGNISGTPNYASPDATYLITATNYVGKGYARINIKVNQLVVPDDFFTVEAKAESCPGSKGSLKVTGKDKLSPFYVNFSSKNYHSIEGVVEITPLVAGTYKFYIEFLGNMSFRQNFKAVIKAATPLTARTSVMENRVAVNIDKGTSPYTVAINGDDQFETESTSFLVSVEPGDVLEVKTAKACEGVYTQSIDEALGNILACFPNPTQGGFEVAMPENVADNADAQIFSMSGVLISSGTYAVKNGKISLSLDSQPDGMYVVKVYTGNKEYALKVIKK